MIQYLQPDRWWLENPQTGHLKNQPYMQTYPYIDVDYCQYSDWGYKKPTRIWGSPDILQVQGKLCDGVTCPNLIPGTRGHKVKISNLSNISRNKKYRIPEKLVKALAAVHPPTSAQAREPSPCRHIQMPERLCRPVDSHLLGHVVKKGNAKQLLIKIRATQPDGRQVDLHALIDTGAQANLIKKGLLHPSVFRPSQKPLALITADGTKMDGGLQEVTLNLKFSARKKFGNNYV